MRIAGDYAAVSLRIALVVLGAVVLRLVVHRAVDRLVRRAVATPAVPEALRQRLIDQSPAAA